MDTSIRASYEELGLENTSGSPSGLVSPHSEYLRLGPDAAARASAYRGLFQRPMSDDELDEIRRNACKERVLGSEDFRRRISTQLDREVGIVRPGRPAKDRGESNQVPFPEI